MPGNPKDSKWRSTPESARNKPHANLTLSLDAHVKLERLAALWGKSKSAVVERLILEAPEDKPP